MPAGTGQFIVENTSHLPRRRRFNVAHEMAHVLLEHEFDRVMFSAEGRRRESNPCPRSFGELGPGDGAVEPLGGEVVDADHEAAEVDVVTGPELHQREPLPAYPLQLLFHEEGLLGAVDAGQAASKLRLRHLQLRIVVQVVVGHPAGVP
ncbi:ImmA/IrrE family metallo-endopeptidase [Micromonospora arida]